MGVVSDYRQVVPANGTSDEDIPDGWVTTTIGQVCQVNPTKPPKNALPPDAPVTFVPMPSIDAETGTIASPLVRPFGEVRDGFTSFQDGDVIVAKITPCMENGKAAVAHGLTNGFGFGSSEFHVLRPSPAVSSDYIYYFVRQERFRRAAEANMTGSVGQRRVPAQFIIDAPLPLPPLAEQARIVAHIKATSARLQEVRARLGRAQSILRRFRQSVLAAACSGRLTEDWRSHQQHTLTSASVVEGMPEGAFHLSPRNRLRSNTRVTFLQEDVPVELPDTWQLTTFGNVCDEVTVGFVGPMAAEYVQEGVSFLRSQNVREFRLELDNVKFISQQFHERLSKSALHPGDIVVVRSGKPGTACVIPKELAIANCADLVIARPSQHLVAEYGSIYLNSTAAQAHIGREKVGIAQGHFNIGAMRRMPLALPPIAEQHEIVRRVEALFKLADTIEQRVAAATTQVDKLSQAMLAKGFRGELVQTEAELARREEREYEPASVLLERIRL